jgi:hypothetical protein
MDIGGKNTYVLELKPQRDGVRGERINKCTAYSLSEAVNTFASIKQLRPDQLLEIYSVYEQPTDGK